MGLAAAAVVDACRLTGRAFPARGTVVCVLDEASLYRHRSTLQATIAASLRGGICSLRWRTSAAAHAHAVTLDNHEQGADAVLWLLGGHGASGQVTHCGTAHVGRPPV